MKKCYKCEEEKPSIDFYRKPDGHLYAYCRACQKRTQKDHRTKNSYYLSKFGISQKEYNYIFKMQEGCCAICRRESDKTLHVDHDHSTGEIRGLLCGPCNRGIGLFSENPMRLRRAAAYVEGSNLSSLQSMRTEVSNRVDTMLEEFLQK